MQGAIHDDTLQDIYLTVANDARISPTTVL